MQAIYATGKKFEVGSDTSAVYDITAIPAARTALKTRAAGDRLIFKDNSVRLERTLRDGTKTYFDLRGKAIR